MEINIDAFPMVPCLATVEAPLIKVNPAIAEAEDLDGLNRFLTGSNEVDGKVTECLPAILKNYHHRSAELPKPSLRRDSYGGVHEVRRLKGMGLYSGPKSKWLHKVRNIKKDPTGYVLGLQEQYVFEHALEQSNYLLEMGIETEVPEGAFQIREIIWRTREGLYVRKGILEAFREAGLPEEYKDVPFIIRVDAMGNNHRLQDFVLAHDLIREVTDTAAVRNLMIEEAIAFLKREHEILGRPLPNDFVEDWHSYLEFIVQRIAKNVALLHRQHGVHGQLTMQNLTLDGKFIDYDTLMWHAEATFEEARIKDLGKLMDSLRRFIESFLTESGILAENLVTEQHRFIEAGERAYEDIYRS